MKGWKLLELIRSWKKIDFIQWTVAGDPWQPDYIGVLVSADGKSLEFPIGSPAVSSKVKWFDAVCIYLMVNKILELAERRGSFSVVGADREYIRVVDAVKTDMGVVNEQKQ